MACLMRLYLRRPRGFPSTSACRQGLTDLNGPLHSAHRGLAWGVDKGLLEGAFWAWYNHLITEEYQMSDTKTISEADALN